jgi:hypothetical protein
MAAELWVSVASVAGVAVGGGISFVSQWFAQRLELRRHAIAVGESRRAERLTELRDFLRLAEQAQRVAIQRHDKPSQPADWEDRATAAVAALWVAERVVEMLCSSPIRDAAHAYAESVHAEVYKGVDHNSVTVNIRPSRRAFIEASREDLTN